MELTPVGEVWGVGPRYAEMLHAHDIFTTWDLRNTPDDWIRQQMTVVGLRTVQGLRGIACHPLELTTATRRLWDEEQSEQMRKAMTAMDAINQKLGRDTVRLGLYSGTGSWQTRFRKRSPRFTTKWDELMTVK